jgi:hypothetical protein
MAREHCGCKAGSSLATRFAEAGFSAQPKAAKPKQAP